MDVRPRHHPLDKLASVLDVGSRLWDKGGLQRFGGALLLFCGWTVVGPAYIVLMPVVIVLYIVSLFVLRLLTSPFRIVETLRSGLAD